MMARIKDINMSAEEALKRIRAIKWDGSYLRKLERAQKRTLKSSLQIG